MAFTESEVRELSELLGEIESRKEHKYAAPTYRDVPSIKKMMQIVGDRLALERDAEAQTLTDSIAVLSYVAECYGGLGRFSVSADICVQVLKLSRELYARFGESVQDSDDVLYKALRARNYYVDDDCDDIRGICSSFMDAKTVDRMIGELKVRRRSLRHDPVEMTSAYLEVIDAVEQRIEENRNLLGHGSCFEVWGLKRQYLLEYGIIWHTPAELNPRVHFD